ncbi:hypothetical protein RRG08_006387 [Elysia crispata]|uniref:Uncharacterized protein n=1 Tax=Elysia crispata TaxID=231223 RepID=A0AAE0Y286_9GAST|nr:hypothetical protein RRG08_006387 [Elysia crispata]
MKQSFRITILRLAALFVFIAYAKCRTRNHKKGTDGSVKGARDKHKTRSCKKGADGSVNGARGFEQSCRSTTLMYSSCICLYCFGFPQPNIEQEAARKEQMDQCKEQENETKLQNYNPQLAALFVFIANAKCRTRNHKKGTDGSVKDFTRQTQDKKLFPQPNIEQEAARKEQMDQCKEQENETKLQNYNPQLAALFVFIANAKCRTRNHKKGTDGSVKDFTRQTQDKKLFPQPNVEQGAARKEQMDQYSNSQTQDKELFPQPNIEQEAARKEQMDQCKEQENETKLQNYNPQLAALFVFIAYGQELRESNTWTYVRSNRFKQSCRITTLRFKSSFCPYYLGNPQLPGKHTLPTQVMIANSFKWPITRPGEAEKK